MSRGTLASNTAWNLAGALLPVPVVLVCVPPLVAALGVERFGVLGLAWMVLGYFGMFDFGLAQSTTRSVSSAVARGEQGTLGALVRGSLLLHAVLGIVGAVVFALLVPWLTEVFRLPASLLEETRTALYFLAASVPAMVVTAALRGALEGLQRFDAVNLIRIPASVVNYAGPLLALGFGTRLPIVVGVIVVARYLVLAAYALTYLQLVPKEAVRSRITRSQLVALASYGGWLTATNFLNPLIIAVDRFVIGAAISAAAVAFYVTPYEVITKAWILSASLMAAMFPLFASAAARDPGSIRTACRSAQRYLLALAAPFILVVVGAADLLLGWWLGDEFRQSSSAVARLLAVGVLVNIVAQVPLTALNAAGRADVSAWIAACELPVYALAAWLTATRFGIDGVAAVWAARALLDAAALSFAAGRILPAETRASTGRRNTGAVAVVCAFLAAAWVLPYMLDDIGMRLTAVAGLGAGLVAWEWRALLGSDERENLRQLCSRLLTSAAR